MRVPRLYVHVIATLIAGLALRLFFIWRFPFASGDTPYYEELARNWLYHGGYGFYSSNILVASDARVPGYPAFLALIYWFAGPSRTAVSIVQAIVDLGTCVLSAMLAARLAYRASERARQRVVIATLWLAVLCPFVANYTAVPLTEVLATFLTTLAILIFVQPSAFRFDFTSQKKEILRSVRTWFLGGFVIGLATLVRPESPLLLAAVVLVYGLRWWRPIYWRRLALATLWICVGLVVPLVPWAARNARVLGRAQFLAPRYAETYGVIMPTGFYAWTKTWMFRSRDAYLIMWKLPHAAIAFDDLPSYAFDSPQERNYVANLIERYNRERGMSALTDAEFARLAYERSMRHPVRSYVWIPAERVAAMWFTPRIAILPYSGKLWPIGDAWRNNAVDFSVTLGLGVLNFFYAGLALFGLKHWRESPGMAIIASFVVVRTVFLTQLQTCEPRYVLECIPAVIAVGAQVLRGRVSAPATSAATEETSAEFSTA